MPRAIEDGKKVVTFGTSLPTSLFELTQDYIAKHDDVSRSRLLATALEEFLRRESKRKTKRVWKQKARPLPKIRKRAEF